MDNKAMLKCRNMFALGLVCWLFNRDLKIAEDFGVKPEECMYIGDTKTDMQTGNAAGMYTVGALWGFRDREELENNGADIVAVVPGDLFTIYEEKQHD